MAAPKAGGQRRRARSSGFAGARDQRCRSRYWPCGLSRRQTGLPYGRGSTLPLWTRCARGCGLLW